MSHTNPEFPPRFIPAPADVETEPGPPPVSTQGSYTDFPLINDADWKRIATAFRLPGHYDKIATRGVTSIVSIPRTYSFNEKFKEKLWMHVAMTRPPEKALDLDYDAFALAATHFQTQNTTFAIMVGCSKDQIDKVKSLVQGWKDAVGHPLLMLVICAELHLDRLDGLITEREGAYRKLLNDVQANATSNNNDKFSWELIEEVRSTREKGLRIEAEVNTTRLQLSNAVSSSISKLLAHYRAEYGDSPEQSDNASRYLSADPKGKSPIYSISSDINDTDSTADELQRERDQKLETLHLFEERFNDILSRLDGLSAQCRISVEGISFTTDIIRSELARQEAQLGRREALISAKNTKLGVAISFIALTYLPLTAVASIMGMPIFQWTNDWRDWRYRRVGRSNSPATDTGPENRLPVVSGYIAIYFPIAIGLMIITLASFACYYYRHDDGLLLNTNSGGGNPNDAQASKRHSLEKSQQLLASQKPSSMSSTTQVESQVIGQQKSPPPQKHSPSLQQQQQQHPLPMPQMPKQQQQKPQVQQQIQKQPVPPQPQQQSSPDAQQEPGTPVPPAPSQASRVTVGDIKTGLKLEHPSLEKPVLPLQGQPSAVVALPSKPQGNNGGGLSHSSKGLNLGTKLNPAPETSAAKINDVAEDEKKILSGTPGHQLV
ncbi:hypothetical protein GGR58DRAFT_518626 [Xylaria digitata]|nr:hypothetical protein GGR58DRAFT_518626 [Xylaria digitata]